MGFRTTGLVQVYTGNGKGKTTAALGLAVRASGHGERVCVVQYMKGNRRCGEHKFADRYKAFEIVQPSKVSCFSRGQEEMENDADRCTELARRVLAGGMYGMVVLDEILTACDAGLVPVAEILRLISAKSPSTELVLTGRGAPPEVIDQADLVTEMRELKHPYHQGVPARKGVEF